MLERRLNLRIKPGAHEGHLWIPKYVGAGRYCANDYAKTVGIVAKHETVIEACLKRKFFVDQVYSKKADCFSSQDVDKLLVRRGQGPIESVITLKQDLISERYFQILFYLPIETLWGQALGFAEIRNVEALYRACERVYKEINTPDDL